MLVITALADDDSQKNDQMHFDDRNLNLLLPQMTGKLCIHSFVMGPLTAIKMTVLFDDSNQDYSN